MGITAWREGLGFGFGFDSLDGTPKQLAVEGMPQAPANAAGQTGDFSLVKVESAEEFSSQLDIDVEIEGTYGLFSASAKVGFQEKCKYTSQASFCVVRALAVNAYEQMSQPKLVPEAWDLLAKGNDSRFRERFGDVFVSGQTSGVEFYGVVRITANSKDTQTKLTADVQAAYGLMVSGEVNAASTISMSSTEHRIEIQTYQKGGEVGTCTDFKQLLDRANEALAAGRNGKAYPYAVRLVPYKELALPNDGASIIDVQAAKRILGQLARAKDALVRMQNDLEHVVQNQDWYVDPKVTEINAALKQIATELQQIRELANTCVTDMTKNVVYEPNYPTVTGLVPELKAGTPQPQPTPVGDGTTDEIKDDILEVIRTPVSPLIRHDD